MKKVLTLFVIAGIFFTSCQKFDEAVEDTQDNPAVPTDDPIAVNSMDNLTISDSFDWSLTKTLNIEVNLPRSACF